MNKLIAWRDIALQHERLIIASNKLKSEFLSLREEWCITQDEATLNATIAFLEALNHIELTIYNKKVTSLLDVNQPLRVM